MFPEAGGNLLEHHSTLIDNEGHNLGWRTLHLEMNLRRLVGVSLFWLGRTNLDKEVIDIG